MRFLVFVALGLVCMSSQAQSRVCLDLFQKDVSQIYQYDEAPQSPESENAPVSSYGLALSPRDEIFDQNKIAQNMVSIARSGYLLTQIDPVLGKHNLLQPNGGLCASTCIANVAVSMMVPAKNINKIVGDYADLMAIFVKEYNARTQQDARYGAIIEEMASVVIELFRKYDSISLFDKPMDATIVDPSEKRMVRFLKNNSLLVGVVDPLFKFKYLGESRPHAIVILAIDTHHRVIYISDPNNPNEILRQSYFLGKDGRLILTVPTTYGSRRVRLMSATGFFEVP